MTSKRRGWTVRLTAVAEADFAQIISWTAEQFGVPQGLIYAETLASALEALGDGPAAIGVRSRDDIVEGLFCLHVARGRRKGRHFILFRIAPRSEHVVEVLRILHDSMDLQRHLRTTEQES